MSIAHIDIYADLLSITLCIEPLDNPYRDKLRSTFAVELEKLRCIVACQRHSPTPLILGEGNLAARGRKFCDWNMVNARPKIKCIEIVEGNGLLNRYGRFVL